MNWLTRKITRELSDRAVRPFASEARTLEVGAYGKPSYGRFFPDRIGIDIREGPGVDRIASVYSLPFADGEFQNVLCMSVLEHLEDPPRAIAEMRRILQPGGHCIISVPFLFPIHDTPGDYWRFTKFGLRHLFRDGWHIESLRAESDTQDAVAILAQRLAYQGRYRADKLVKGFLLLLARILHVLPRFPRTMYGDIHKKIEEPDAFATAFFLVARKV